MRYECKIDADITLAVQVGDPFHLTRQERERIAGLVKAAVGRAPDDFRVEEFSNLPREDWPLFVSAGGDVVAEFHPVE